MFVKFDENNNCIRYGLKEKIDSDCLEVGIDIDWIIDIKRANNLMTISVKELLPEDEIIKFYDNPSEIKKEGNTIRLKTLEELKYEKYKTIQNAMLNDPSLTALRDAMTFQTITESKGASPENKIFTDEQISNFGNYFGSMAKDGHDLSALSLEEITPAIFGQMPELPAGFQNIIK